MKQYSPIVIIVTTLLVGILAGCADYDLLDTVAPVPPEAVSVSVTSVTDSSVTLSWTKSVCDSFKGYIVYYNNGDYVGLTDKIYDTLSFAIDTTVTIGNLSDLSLYSFRVSVISQNGTFAPGNIAKTTTLERMNGKLRLFWDLDSNGTDIQLRWTKCTTPCTQYRIYFDSTAVVDSTDSLFTIINGVSDTSYTIRNFSSETFLWYRVYAKNDILFVAKSNIIELQIELTVVPPAGEP